MITERSNHLHKDVFIYVPDGNKIWTSGEVIRGVVRVKPTARPQRVNIIFRGRTKCAITRSNGQSSTTYKEKPECFLRILELFSSATRRPNYEIIGQGITQDDRVNLPFEFIFPSRTEIPPDSKWLDEPPFSSSHGGPLPPSYYYAGLRNEQLIEYFLEARLYTTNRFHPTNEVRCPLLYRPSIPIPKPIPPLPLNRGTFQSTAIFARTHRLHPDYDPHENWRAKLKHSLTKNKDSTPFVKFRVAALCPSVIVSGQHIQLTLTLEHLDHSDDVPEPPLIFLRRIRMRLSSKLIVRIPSRSLFSSRSMYESHSEDHLILDAKYPVDEGLLVYDGMPVVTPRFPKGIAPEFDSYGLSLRHALQVVIWGECAKEKFQIMPVYGSVVITAAPERPSAVLSSSPLEMDGEQEDKSQSDEGADVLHPPRLEEDTAPPPYQVLDKNG